MSVLVDLAHAGAAAGEGGSGAEPAGGVEEGARIRVTFSLFQVGRGGQQMLPVVLRWPMAVPANTPAAARPFHGHGCVVVAGSSVDGHCQHSWPHAQEMVWLAVLRWPTTDGAATNNNPDSSPGFAPQPHAHDPSPSRTPLPARPPAQSSMFRRLRPGQKVDFDASLAWQEIVSAGWDGGVCVCVCTGCGGMSECVCVVGLPICFMAGSKPS